MLGFGEDDIGPRSGGLAGLIHGTTSTASVLSSTTHAPCPGAPQCGVLASTQAGDYRWMLCRGMAVCDRDGRPCAWRAQTDIHDRKLAEERLLRDSPARRADRPVQPQSDHHRLHQAIDRVQRQPNRRFAVLFLGPGPLQNVMTASVTTPATSCSSNAGAAWGCAAAPMTPWPAWVATSLCCCSKHRRGDGCDPGGRPHPAT